MRMPVKIMREISLESNKLSYAVNIMFAGEFPDGKEFGGGEGGNQC